MIMAPDTSLAGSRKRPGYPVQNEGGAYSTVYPPTGSAKTGYQLTPPQPKLPPAPTGVTPPPPTAGGAPPRGTAGAGAPQGNGYDFTKVNTAPSIAGQSMIAPVAQKPAVLLDGRNGVPAPPPAPSPTPMVPTGTAAAPAIAPITGNESEYNVNPVNSGTTSSLMSQLAAEAGRQLANPTVYDDALAKQIKDSQTAGIDDNYRKAGLSLDASLADRGINYSTIAGGDIMDLNKAHAGALNAVDAQIAQERANALAAGRTAAFGNASTALGQSYGIDANNRDEQRTERGYTDTLRNTARDQALQDAGLSESSANNSDQSWQALLNQIFGSTSNSAANGDNLLGGAANIYTGGSAAAAGQQSQSEDQLAQLAQLLFSRGGK